MTRSRGNSGLILTKNKTPEESSDSDAESSSVQTGIELLEDELLLPE